MSRTAQRSPVLPAAPPDPLDGGLRLEGPVVDRGTGALRAGRWGDRPVLVRRLPLGGDAGLRAHALLLARRLIGLAHPALAVVLTVDSDWDGLDLAYEVPEATGSLATLLARRPLGPGEVLGVGLAAADALATLHRAGLCHGRLSAADLLIRPDGSVLLTGYGIAGVLGSAGSPEEDTADLVRLLAISLEDAARAGLGHPADDRLRRELDHLGADPRRTAEDLLAALADLPMVAEPIRLAGRRPPAAVHRRPPRRRWRAALRLTALPVPKVGWRVLGAALPAAVGVLLLAGWLGASLPDAVGETPAVRPGGAPPPTATSPMPTATSPTATTPTQTPTRAPGSRSSPSASAVVPTTPPPPTRAPDWTAVLTGLNEARSHLFSAPDERRVGTVDAPGSSAYASDLALVRDLVAHGARSSGLRTEVESVRVLTAGASHAELSVVDVLHPYTVLSTTEGRVLQQRLGRPARTTTVTLVAGGGSWRVAEVRPG